MPKIKKAHSVEQDLCECGCKAVTIYLCDQNQNRFACFTLDENQWLPFAEDAIRICQGEEPVGPPQRVLQ
jgi:hypothetical protein